MYDDNFIQKLDNMSKMGYRVMTVADLVAKLAGQPPMMEVYVDADGAAMFLNDVQLQQAEGFPPFLRLICSLHPAVPQQGIQTHEEQVAMQRQRAMHMSAVIERESHMSEIVE